MEIKTFLIKGVVVELQSAEFADFSKLRHPSWSTTAELEASVEPRNSALLILALFSFSYCFKICNF